MNVYPWRQASKKSHWAAITAAVLVALVALIAFAGTGAVTAAAAAKHPAHSTHSTKKGKPTPTTPAFALDITCAEGWTWTGGSNANVCVHTVPGATLTITVRACGKVVHDPALSGTATANSSGQYAGDYVWSWSPASSCRTQRATVKATSGGKSVTKATHFTLQRITTTTNTTANTASAA